MLRALWIEWAPLVLRRMSGVINEESRQGRNRLFAPYSSAFQAFASPTGGLVATGDPQRVVGAALRP